MLGHLGAILDTYVVPKLVGDGLLHGGRVSIHTGRKRPAQQSETDTLECAQMLWSHEGGNASVALLR